MITKAMCCFVFCLSIYVSGCDNNEGAGTHYQQKKDVKSLYAVLCGQVENGCSIDEIHRSLGQEDLSMSERGNSIVKKLAEKTPSSFPNGFQVDDQVLAYTTSEDFTVFLQFRNGHLINHNPAEFKKMPKKPEVSIITN